jgi:SpoVK/Ycf46/Vps4 family AAA+-type ATPase
MFFIFKEITKPEFLPFLMQNRNSILIIEDAENIIRDRTHDQLFPNQAVSNLLNLSDGLLGDAMHQQIICTFNCDIKGVDPALMRDGRLVIEHKFDKLNPREARRICQQLEIPGNGEDIQQPITLAEIYARKNQNGHTTTTIKNKQTLNKTKQQGENLFGLYS